MRSCPAPSRSVAVRDPLRRKRSVRAGIKQTGPLRCRRVRPRGRVLCRLSLLRDPRSRIGQGQLRLPPGRRVMINEPGFARSMAQPPSLPARPPQQINTSGTLIGSHRTDWSECGVGADRVPLVDFASGRTRNRRLAIFCLRREICALANYGSTCWPGGTGQLETIQAAPRECFPDD